MHRSPLFCMLDELDDKKNHTRRRRCFVKRVAYLALAALVALTILAPTALAQDAVPGDDDPYLPEPNAIVVGSHEELERIAGQPVPSQPVPSQPSASQPLPKTGGPSVVST